MAKILLADDSAHAQRMGAKILAAEGYQVVTVGNGQAAIQALEKSVPDLVVADIYMPGRDGFEVCRFIKTDERLKNIPVLLTIGAMEPYDPELGRRARADGLITKPLESSNLIATVKELLLSAKSAASARRPKRQPAPAANAAVVDETISGHWEQQVNEQTTAPARSAIVIPEEMSQQPVGMLAELPDSFSVSDPPAEPATETAPQPPSLAVSQTHTPNEPSPVAGEILEPAGAAQLPGSQQLETADATVWTAQPAPITLEDEMLFDHSAAEWAGLAKLAEQDAAEPAVPAADPLLATPELSEPWPASSPADYDPAPAEASVCRAELALPVQQDLESFDSLDAVVAAPPTSSPAAALTDDYGPLTPPADCACAADSTEHFSPLWSTADPATKLPPAGPAEAGSSAGIAGEADPVMSFSASEALGAVDELVRQTVEQMLPRIVDQIVERVLQTLKS